MKIWESSAEKIFKYAPNGNTWKKNIVSKMKIHSMGLRVKEIAKERINGLNNNQEKLSKLNHKEEKNDWICNKSPQICRKIPNADLEVEENRAGEISENTMAEKLPNLTRDINPITQEAQQSQTRIKTKNITLRENKFKTPENQR